MNSSYIGRSATPPPGAAFYPTPTTHPMVTQSTNSSSMPSSSTPPLGASPSPPPLPPPKRFSMPPPLPSRQRLSTLSSLSSVGVSSHTMPPRGSRPPPEFRETTPQLAARGWGPFFLEDMSPTAVFVQLMNGIFTYLDTGCTGSLVPETYSRFLINQGYVGQENTCTSSSPPHFPSSRLDLALTYIQGTRTSSRRSGRRRRTQRTRRSSARTTSSASSTSSAPARVTPADPSTRSRASCRLSVHPSHRRSPRRPCPAA